MMLMCKQMDGCLGRHLCENVGHCLQLEIARGPIPNGTFKDFVPDQLLSSNREELTDIDIVNISNSIMNDYVPHEEPARSAILKLHRIADSLRK